MRRGHYRHRPRYHGLSPLLLPLLIIFTLALALGISFAPASALHLLPSVLGAAGATFLRLLISYAISVLLAIPLAILVTRNAKIESIVLPVIDILESIPILAFFPIIILLFVRSNFLEGAAIFVLTVSMLWNVLFALIGGLKLVPEAVSDVAKVFNIKGLLRFRSITMPAMFPELVTGSILAVADGWNIIIVAEVLHTYVTGGTQALDLFGLGSLMVRASASGNTTLFILCLAAMVVVIAVVNIFVWQKLLKVSEHYRFD